MYAEPSDSRTAALRQFIANNPPEGIKSRDYIEKYRDMLSDCVGFRIEHFNKIIRECGYVQEKLRNKTTVWVKKEKIEHKEHKPVHIDLETHASTREHQEISRDMISICSTDSEGNIRGTTFDSLEDAIEKSAAADALVLYFPTQRVYMATNEYDGSMILTNLRSCAGKHVAVEQIVHINTTHKMVISCKKDISKNFEIWLRAYFKLELSAIHTYEYAESEIICLPIMGTHHENLEKYKEMLFCMNESCGEMVNSVRFTKPDENGYLRFGLDLDNIHSSNEDDASNSCSEQKISEECRAVYVLSTRERAKLNLYKIGKHTGNQPKLLSRYKTALIDPYIFHFHITANYSETEQELLSVLDEFRVKDENDKQTEWVNLKLPKILKALFKLQSKDEEPHKSITFMHTQKTIGE